MQDEGITFIENFAGSGIDVSVLSGGTLTRSVGDVKQSHIRLDGGGGGVHFYMRTERLSETQTRSIMLTTDGLPVVSFTLDGDQIVDIGIDNASISGWWGCVKTTWKVGMDAINSDNWLRVAHRISDVGYMATLRIPEATEIMVGTASVVHCLKRTGACGGFTKPYDTADDKGLYRIPADELPFVIEQETSSTT